MSKSEILLHWLNEAFGNKNLQSLETLMTPDSHCCGALSRGPIGKAELAEFILCLRSLTGPCRFSISHCIEQEDWIAARVYIHTSCARTGEAFDFTDHLMVRFEGEKLAEILSQSDYFTLFEKLGQLPSDALAACMGGQILN